VAAGPNVGRSTSAEAQRRAADRGFAAASGSPIGRISQPDDGATVETSRSPECLRIGTPPFYLGSANAVSVDPDGITTNCRPSSKYVVGGAKIADPVEYSYNFFPVVESATRNVPS
jgi:hypothetical protein